LGVNYSHKNRELARAAHEIVRARGFDLALVMAGASVPHGTTRVLEGRVAPSDATYVLPEVASSERNWLLRHASLVWYPTSAEGFGLVPFEAAVFGTPTVAVGFGPVEELALARSGSNRFSHAGEVPGFSANTEPRSARNFTSDDTQPRDQQATLRAPSTEEAFERTGVTGRIDRHGADVPVLARDWSPEALAEVAIAFLSDPDLARRHCAALNDSGRHYSWSRTADALVETFRESLSQPRR
jgi:glycosyltransferase involved in cell wall biosynthesis